jgi:hypothetical protein
LTLVKRNNGIQMGLLEQLVKSLTSAAGVAVPKKRPAPRIASTSLPHPEEPPNYAVRTSLINPRPAFEKWLKDWEVPPKHWGFWNSVKVVVKTDIHYAAATWSDKKLLWIRPEWCNPGVIAHEMSHISYWYLSPGDKKLFNNTWRQFQSDPYLNLLVTKRPNTGKSNVEAHAEIYRFLGVKMPAGLKKFYPYLF